MASLVLISLCKKFTVDVYKTHHPPQQESAPILNALLVRKTLNLYFDLKHSSLKNLPLFKKYRQNITIIWDIHVIFDYFDSWVAQSFRKTKKDVYIVICDCRYCQKCPFAEQYLKQQTTPWSGVVCYFILRCCYCMRLVRVQIFISWACFIRSSRKSG